MKKEVECDKCSKIFTKQVVKHGVQNGSYNLCSDCSRHDWKDPEANTDLPDELRDIEERWQNFRTGDTEVYRLYNELLQCLSAIKTALSTCNDVLNQRKVKEDKEAMEVAATIRQEIIRELEDGDE